jgi:hypothetical protein
LYSGESGGVSHVLNALGLHGNQTHVNRQGANANYRQDRNHEESIDRTTTRNRASVHDQDLLLQE